MDPDTSSDASTKAVQKLKAAIDAGDLYSALQLFKTQAARAKKKGDWAQAIELARGGAETLLDKGECNAGAELARDFVDLLKTACGSDTPDVGAPSAERMAQLVNLDSLFGKIDSEEAARERTRFLKLAIDYSSECGQYSFGDPALHRAASRAALKKKDLLNASKHLVHAHNPEELCALTVSWAKMGPEGDRDLYLARAVLQLLCTENLKDANVLYRLFLEQVPLDTPMTRFTGFLLKALEREAYPLFKTLREKYAPALARTKGYSPSLDNYLDRVALLFYGVKP